MLFAFSLRLFASRFLLLVVCALPVGAQSVSDAQPSDTPPLEKKPASSNTRGATRQQQASEARPKRWLQSNDLLVETPYTQERGEVQHTFRLGRTRAETWAATFEQEWPLWSAKHQLSFTVPSQLGRNDAGARGFGDVTVEYAYQLIGNNESRVTLTPKLGVSFPTGKVAQELGIGAPGVEVSVPVGVQLTPSFGMVSNVAASTFGKAVNSEGERYRYKRLEAGHSFVWYARPRFNALLEAKWERAIAVEDAGERQRRDEFFVAPGIRWAHLWGKAVIAPGISFPIGVGPSRRDRGVIFSLVIEHGFGKRRG